MVAPKIATVLVLVLAIGSVAGYLYYYETRPGSFSLEVFGEGSWVLSPDCSTCAGIQDPSVLGIWLNYGKVEVHSAGDTNQTGWTTIFSSGGSSDYRRTGDQPIVFDIPKFARGDYDYIRFNVTSAIVNIKNIGNETYTIVGGGFTPPFNGGGGFRVSPGKYASAWVTITLLSAEIHNGAGYLTPRAFAYADAGAYGCAPNTCPLGK